MNIGIIGSAGRGEDFYKFTKVKYNEYGHTILNIIHNHRDALLISGGSAFCDFIAVSIAYRHQFRLRLHLPAKFDLNKKEYIPTTNSRFDPANIINFHHRKFSTILKRNSLCELAKVIEKGAQVVVTPGFKERNTKVAQDADVLIAATFGDGKNLKPGGTLDTWNKFTNLKPTNKKFHIDLHTGLVYDC